MKIQIPTVGPIVGYTEGTRARIWLRGEFEPTEDGYRRCFGAVRIRRKGRQFGDARFTKLAPYFDSTGVCVFSGLQPETDYEYQAGWFYAETSLDNLTKTQILDWKNAETYSFRTAAVDQSRTRNYVAGSCRYLLKLFGGTIFDERGDKIFYSILQQIKNGNRVDGLIMTGDQIYADDLNFLFPDKTLEEFLGRYRTVFGQNSIRELMSKVPTYMILDDHEIEDNWPEKATEKDKTTLYPHAIHAYQVYQCSHSPLFTVDNNDRIDGTLTKFWYTFQDGCCDWFVMDSRTERVWNSDADKRRMIKPAQMDALLQWLSDGSGNVKMVVTSVPFFPDLTEENSDKWGGFPAERSRILNHIYENKIRKVVFVSGDVHCSFSAELTVPGDPEFKIISVVSSSFFWPYPHMEESGFEFSGALPNNKHNFVVSSASDVYSTDNFARLAVSPDQIDITFFERKGAQLGQTISRKF